MFSKNSQKLKFAAKNILKFLISALTSGTTNLLDAFEEIIDILLYAINGNSDEFGAAVAEIINAIILFITTNTRPLLETAFVLIKALVNGLLEADSLNLLSECIFDIIYLLAEFINDNLEWVVSAALGIIIAIVTALNNEESRQKLFDAIILIIDSIVDAVYNNLDDLFDAATAIITFLADSLLSADALAKIAAVVLELLERIAEKLMDEENLKDVYESGGKLVKSIIDAIAGFVDFDGIDDFFENLFNRFLEKIKETDWESLGKALLNSFLSGITGIDFDVDEFLEDMWGEGGNWKTGLGIKTTIDPKGIADTFRAANNDLHTGITSSITNNSTNNFDNSSNITYYVTNNNNIETRSTEAREIGQELNGERKRNERGLGY